MKLKTNQDSSHILNDKRKAVGYTKVAEKVVGNTKV
jgi:hypothetical protein